MADPAERESDLTAPARRAIDIYAAKSDSVDLTNFVRAFYVGSTGDVKINTPYGDTVTFKAVQAGTLLPVRVARLWSTGTTVTDCIGLI